MLSEENVNNVEGVYNPFNKFIPDKDASVDGGHTPTETTIASRKKFHYLASDISGRTRGDNRTRRDPIMEEQDYDNDTVEANRDQDGNSGIQSKFDET